MSIINRDKTSDYNRIHSDNYHLKLIYKNLLYLELIFISLSILCYIILLFNDISLGFYLGLPSIQSYIYIWIPISNFIIILYRLKRYKEDPEKEIGINPYIVISSIIGTTLSHLTIYNATDVYEIPNYPEISVVIVSIALILGLIGVILLLLSEIIIFWIIRNLKLSQFASQNRAIGELENQAVITLQKLINVVKSIKTEKLVDLLQMDKKFFLDFIQNNSDRFNTLSIMDDMIIINKDDNINKFLESLDMEFTKWDNLKQKKKL